jgi:hypothetical protein
MQRKKFISTLILSVFLVSVFLVPSCRAASSDDYFANKGFENAAQITYDATGTYLNTWYSYGAEQAADIRQKGTYSAKVEYGSYAVQDFNKPVTLADTQEFSVWLYFESVRSWEYFFLTVAYAGGDVTYNQVVGAPIGTWFKVDLRYYLLANEFPEDQSLTRITFSQGDSYEFDATYVDEFSFNAITPSNFGSIVTYILYIIIIAGILALIAVVSMAKLRNK